MEACKEGKDFSNSKGLEFRFRDQTPLAHLQFWAARKYQHLIPTINLRLILFQSRQATVVCVTITTLFSARSIFRSLLARETEVYGGSQPLSPLAIPSLKFQNIMSLISTSCHTKYRWRMGQFDSVRVAAGRQ